MTLASTLSAAMTSIGTDVKALLGADAQNVKQVTKKSAYRFGGVHSTSNMGGTSSTQTTIRERTPPLRLPVNASRWRFHFRNYNSLTSSNAGSYPVQVTRAYVGVSAGLVSTNTASPYNTAAAMTLLPSGSSYVSGTDEWTSDWHTPASVGITDTRIPFNAQFDLKFTAADYIATTSSMWCAMIDAAPAPGVGTGVLDPKVANIGTLGTSASTTSWYTYNYMVGEVWIEYEWIDSPANPIPNVLILGHSYADGAQFTSTPGSFGTPTGFAQKFSRRHAVAVAVNAYSTSKLTDWVSNGGVVSDKMTILTPFQGYNFDAIVIVLGGNDIVNDTTTPTLATMQLRIQNMVNATKAQYPGVPIYLCTNTPFGAAGDTTYGSGGKTVTAAMVTLQAGYNALLYNGAALYGIAGVFDLERAMWDPANNSRPLAAYLGADNIHPNSRGYDRLAEAITLF